MDPAELGRRIRTARAWAGLSQAEAAEAMEVSDSTFGRWEKGEKLPSRAELFYFAEVCEIRRGFFTDEDPGLVDAHAEEFSRAMEAGAENEREQNGRAKGGTAND